MNKIILKVNFLFYFLLLLMIVFPYDLQYFKIILIVLIVISNTLYLFTNNFKYSINIFIWYFLFILQGILFTTLGYFNDPVNAIKVIPVNIIWPIIYFFITIMVVSKNSIISIYKTYILSMILFGLYSTLFIVTSMELIPNIDFLYITQYSSFNVQGFIPSFFLPSITGMIYLIPFLISGFILWSYNNICNFNIKIILYTILLVAFILIFATRRIIWIEIFISPFLTIFLYNIINKNNKFIISRKYKIIFFKIVLYFISIITIFSIFYFDNFIDSFYNSNAYNSLIFQDEGTDLRWDQLYCLLKHWSDSPFIGFGYGASAVECQRSELFPWMFELAYIALLFHIGVLGFIWYFLLIFYIFYLGIRVSRANKDSCFFIIPSLVGLACFLFANSTNTYLEAYDNMWTIFVPVAIINYFQLNKNEPN